MTSSRWIGTLAVGIAALVGLTIAVTSPRSVAETAEVTPLAASDPGDWNDRDWSILQERIRFADRAGLDTIPFRAAVARMGRTFVGWPYTPATLEVGGPERVVVNLREFDCVTFIENTLALVRLHREFDAEAVALDPEGARMRFEALLEEIRYRSGALSGYPSRLHYFTEWLSDNALRGMVDLRTASLGGVDDPEPISFMSTHPDAYRQLADPEALDRIRAIEADLNTRRRTYIPEDRIPEVADRIREGDLIAATSTVAGLDVAHTGIAVRIDGRLHLMHAPLVGSVVEISPLPLAERILRIEAQDGIMVAEPLPGGRSD